MKRRARQQAQFSAFYLAAGIVVLVLLQSWLLTPSIQEVPMSRLLELVREDKVASVSFGEKEIRGVFRKGAMPEAPPSLPEWL